MLQTITIELNGHEYSVELNNSITSVDFMECAPFEKWLFKHNETHYCGPIPKRLQFLEEQSTSNPHKGGIYYADHLKFIAIYYDDPKSINPEVVYHIGDLKNDLSNLAIADFWIKLKISK